MTAKSKVIVSAASVASLAAIGIIVFLSWKNNTEKEQQRLNQIADEGYETAYDILYPLKKNPIRRMF